MIGIDSNKLGPRPHEFIWISLGVAAIPFSLIWLYFFPSDWPWVVGGFVYGKFFVATVGKHIAFHRYICHRSFTTTKWKRYFLLFASTLTSNCPIMAATIHRHHHKYSDTDIDVHSPKLHGLIGSVFWRDRTKAMKQSMKLPVDLMRDKDLMWLHKHTHKLYAVYFVLCFMVSWKLAVFGLLLGTGTAGVVNSLAQIILVHIRLPFSYKNFDIPDNSYNNKVIEFFTPGEGLHNNHHMYPDRYDMAIKPGEWDSLGWIVRKFFANETK